MLKKMIGTIQSLFQIMLSKYFQRLTKKFVNMH
nr:MAG TPA: hypothetical protein [Caudoviricetes sp.]